MKLKKILSLVLAGVMALCVTGCVNQHPEETTSTNESREVRLVATSPAVVQICNRLDLDLVGICQSTSDLPERYDGVTTVGMAMNPDLEIIKSLDPDYILSPATLQNDLQPKYASIGVSSLFLNLKSVEGMYASIEGLGEKFGREEEAAVMLEEFDSFMTEFAEKNAGKESPKVLVLMGLVHGFCDAHPQVWVWVGGVVAVQSVITSVRDAFFAGTWLPFDALPLVDIGAAWAPVAVVAFVIGLLHSKFVAHSRS